MTRVIFLALFCALCIGALSGCGKKPATVDDPSARHAPDTARRTIPAHISELNIYDERRSRSPSGRILHMPDMTLVGQKDRVRPPLTDDERARIDAEARSFFSRGKRAVTVDIYVVEAMQRFEVVEMKEIVVIDFAVRIEMADDRNFHNVRTAEGASKRRHEASDITREKLAEMYEAAIQEAIRDGFEKIQVALR